ncbi:MAG: hypothetical protein HY327_05110 [Chloroflexi bacterium]|nr:hypothetical protein [Chloroflexota bacterium]
MKSQWRQWARYLAPACLIAFAAAALILSAQTALRLTQSVEAVRRLTIDITGVSAESVDGETRLIVQVLIQSAIPATVEVKQIVYAIEVNDRTLGGGKLILTEESTNKSNLSLALPLVLTASAQDQLARANQSGIPDWELSGRINLLVSNNDLWVDWRTRRRSEIK